MLYIIAVEPSLASKAYQMGEETFNPLVAGFADLLFCIVVVLEELP